MHPLPGHGPLVSTPDAQQGALSSLAKKRLPAYMARTHHGTMFTSNEGLPAASAAGVPGARTCGAHPFDAGLGAAIQYRRVELGSWLDDGWGRDHAARACSPCHVAPKGKATRRNSQANGPQPDRTLNAPHAAGGQSGGYTAARGSPATLSFLSVGRRQRAVGSALIADGGVVLTRVGGRRRTVPLSTAYCLLPTHRRRSHEAHPALR
jgi:hypothetical protein